MDEVTPPWFGNDPDNILKGNTWPPDNSILYVEYLGSDLLPYRNATWDSPNISKYQYGLEKFKLTGEVIDARFFDNKGPNGEYTEYLILLKVLECKEKPELVNQEFSANNFRDKISVNPIVTKEDVSKAHQRLAVAKTIHAGSDTEPIKSIRNFTVMGDDQKQQPLFFDSVIKNARTKVSPEVMERLDRELNEKFGGKKKKKQKRTKNNSRISKKRNKTKRNKTKRNKTKRNKK